VSTGGNGPTATSNAAFFDTLTFNIPNATDSTVTNLGIHWVVDGTYAFQGDGNISVDLPVLFGSAEIDPTWSTSQAPTFHFDFGWVSESVNALDTQNFDFLGFIQVTGAHPSVAVRGAINLACGTTIICNDDFSHTGTIGLVLPSDVTYTSASGVFLSTGQASPVPEPSSFVLLGLSLAGIGFVRRRLKATTVRPAKP
jgi:hypothetical protein